MSDHHFDEEELTWPEIDPSWTKKDLLKQFGMFKFSKVKHLLDVETHLLTRFGKKINDYSKLYQQFGIKKPAGSQYVVRMSRFAKTYSNLFCDVPKFIPDFDKLDVFTLPDTIVSANQLSELEGCFYFNEIRQLAPFDKFSEGILKQYRSFESTKKAWEKCGMWRNTKGQYVVALPRFYTWFRSAIWKE